MAGKTLPGIGDDEESDGQSGEKDSSGVSLSGANTEEPTPARPTDRMHHYSGPTVIDEDKVAEGLKRLRSLDEPLGPIPVSTPTLREGMPTVGGGTPLPPIGAAMPGTAMPTLKEGMPTVGGMLPLATTATPAASATGLAELLRARGTSHGHAITGPNAQGQVIVPVAGDDRMKGTLLGHMLHLPDLPPATEERPAEVRPAERAAAASGALTPVVQDFSHGEARFFDAEPERELEPERPRGKLMARAAIAFAVLSIGIVAAIAWVRASKPDSSSATTGEATTGEATTTTLPSSATVGENPSAAPTPTGAVQGAAGAVEGAATPPPPPAAFAPTPVPSEPTATAPVETKQAAAPVAAPPPPPPAPEPSAEAPHPAPAAAPKTHARPTRAPTSPSPASPRAASTSKPSVPGKHVPVVEDPDGTLPLSD
jgi:hypothetical protein